MELLRQLKRLVTFDLGLRAAIKSINRRYVTDCLNVNILTAVYFGAWPLAPDEPNPYLRLTPYIPIVVLMGEFVQFFAMIYNVVHKLHDVELAAEAVMISIVLVQAVVRTYVTIFKMAGIVFAVRTLERCCRDLAGEREKLIFARYKRAAKVFTIVYQIIFSGVATLYAIQPLFETERRLPGNMIFPYDTSTSPMYEVTYVAVFLGGFSTSTVNGVFDAFTISMLVYIIAQFKILQHRLQHLKKTAWENVLKRREEMSLRAISANVRVIPFDSEDIRQSLDVRYLRRGQDWRGPHRERGVLRRGGRRRNNEETSGNQRKREEEYEMERSYLDKRDLENEMDVLMAKYVQLHVTLLNLVKHLEKHLAIVFTCELTVAGTLTCVSLFLTAMYPSDKAQLLLRMSMLVIATGELFAFCWSASELGKQSSAVNEAMYFCDWLEASPSFKKSLQIVIARSLQPVEIMAAPTFPFSMELYRRVLDSGYSFYTIVIQFSRNNM